MSQEAPITVQPRIDETGTADTRAREHPCAVTPRNARDAVPREPPRCLLRKQQQNRAPWEAPTGKKLCLEMTSGLSDVYSCSPGLPKNSLRLSSEPPSSILLGFPASPWPAPAPDPSRSHPRNPNRRKPNRFPVAIEELL